MLLAATLSSLREKTAVFPVFKTVTVPLAVTVNRNNFSRVTVFNIYDLLHILKDRLNPYRRGFRKFNSTLTKIITHLSSITPFVATQKQTDSLCVDPSNASNIVPHNISLVS